MTSDTRRKHYVKRILWFKTAAARTLRTCMFALYAGIVTAFLVAAHTIQLLQRGVLTSTEWFIDGLWLPTIMIVAYFIGFDTAELMKKVTGATLIGLLCYVGCAAIEVAGYSTLSAMLNVATAVIMLGLNCALVWEDPDPRFWEPIE